MIMTGLARLGRNASLRHTPQGEPVVELALAFNFGATVTLDYGIKPLVFDTANVNEFKIECNEGGTVTVTYRVQVRPTEEQLAKLFALLDTAVPVTITPPEAKLAKDLKKAA